MTTLRLSGQIGLWGQNITQGEENQTVNNTKQMPIRSQSTMKRYFYPVLTQNSITEIFAPSVAIMVDVMTEPGSDIMGKLPEWVRGLDHFRANGGQD